MGFRLWFMLCERLPASQKVKKNAFFYLQLKTSIRNGESGSGVLSRSTCTAYTPGNPGVKFTLHGVCVEQKEREH